MFSDTTHISTIYQFGIILIIVSVSTEDTTVEDCPDELLPEVKVMCTWKDRGCHESFSSDEQRTDHEIICEYGY